MRRHTRGSDVAQFWRACCESHSMLHTDGASLSPRSYEMRRHRPTRLKEQGRTVSSALDEPAAVPRQRRTGGNSSDSTGGRLPLVSICDQSQACTTFVRIANPIAAAHGQLIDTHHWWHCCATTMITPISRGPGARVMYNSCTTPMTALRSYSCLPEPRPPRI